jgi:hypothetical protein
VPHTPLTQIALTWILTGCSTGALNQHFIQSTAPATVPVTVALAPAVVLAEMAEMPDGDEVRTGLYVGNLVFGGGFITDELEMGLQNVSKTVDRKAEQEFAKIAVKETDEAVRAALDKRKVDWQPWKAEALPSLVWSNRRGTHPEDGRDNVPLPRLELQAPVVDADMRATWPSGVDAVVVPYVVHYYSHNAGWFLGQTYGTGGGARFRVFVATWDAKTGRPIGATDVTARLLHERTFQPNSGQLEDFLIAVEGHMDKQMSRRLWKDKNGI